MKTEPSTNKQCNSSPEIDLVIDVNITDVVLTPLSCASLVNEVLKGLLYQRSQIPYPYSWLKTVVEKKRKKKNCEESSKKITNFTLENHFRVVSSTYDTLQEIMKNIEKEFSTYQDCIEEVVILFGTTPVCPKEVFILNISSLAKGHYEKNHMNETSKKQHKILRNIFLSQSWIDSVDANMTCSNTYVFIKKRLTDPTQGSMEDLFMPSKPLTMSSKVKKLKINFNYDQSDSSTCCDNLLVFDDFEGSTNYVQRTETKQHSKSDVDMTHCEWWCQSRAPLKGFKDCFINKVSACDLW